MTGDPARFVPPVREEFVVVANSVGNARFHSRRLSARVTDKPRRARLAR